MVNHLTSIAVLFAAYAVAAEATTSKLKIEDYLGKIVQWNGDKSSNKYSWVVGVDGNRRWIPNSKTLQCLKDIKMPGPLQLSYEVLNQIPNIEKAWATCGSNTMGPNETLEKGCYLLGEGGVYKLTLTTSDLALTKEGKIVWSTGLGGDELILQTNGNLVIYNSKRAEVWSTKTAGTKPGYLSLANDGILNLHDGNKKVIWSPKK